MRRMLVLLCCLAGCSGPGPSTPADETPADTTQTPDPTSTPTPQPLEPVRFIAIGDTGTGSPNQYAVAGAIEQKCAADGCDFGVLLGDNFYPTGVDGVDDPQWQEKLELPYENLDFPMYLTLGNHDYGGDGAGYEFNLGAYQIAYAAASDKWMLPESHYDFDAGPGHFLALDTNLIFWNHQDAVNSQGKYFSDALANSTAPWRIAMGHHPYVSNGPHGNAGSYDDLPFVPIANGENVKAFFDQTLCGNIDVYFSGHDHSRQILPGPSHCDTLFVVSGAGAKTTDLPRKNPSIFEKAYEGFAYVIVEQTQLTIEMYDKEGLLDYSHTLTK